MGRAELHGGIGCFPHFVPGKLHFKNNFCDNCRDRYRDCIMVPLAQVCALSAEQAACFVRSSLSRARVRVRARARASEGGGGGGGEAGAGARAGKVEGEGDGEYMSVRARRQARGATSRNNLGALLQKINDLTFTENSATRY